MVIIPAWFAGRCSWGRLLPCPALASRKAWPPLSWSKRLMSRKTSGAECGRRLFCTAQSDDCPRHDPLRFRKGGENHARSKAFESIETSSRPGLSFHHDQLAHAGLNAEHDWNYYRTRADHELDSKPRRSSRPQQGIRESIAGHFLLERSQWCSFVGGVDVGF